MEMRAGLLLAPEELERLVCEVVARVRNELESTRPGTGSEFIGTAAACNFLGCTRQRLYDLRSSGRLTRYGDGRRALYRVSELIQHATGKADTR